MEKALLLLLMVNTIWIKYTIGTSDHEFLTDGGPVTTPQELGVFPYTCLGDVALCDQGFSLSWSFVPPAPRVNVEHAYILSSGGQSSYSKGFYIRQNFGREWEVGVSLQGTTWKTALHLSQDRLVHMLLTWSSSDGLVVYIDGLSMATNPTGSARVHSSLSFDQFQVVMVGAANDVDDAAAGSLDISHVEFWNTALSQQDIHQHFANEDVDFQLGCALAVSSDVTDIITVDTGAAGALECRVHCSTLLARLAFIKDDQCACEAAETADLYLAALDMNSCTVNGEWLVYWVCGYEQASDISIALDVNLKLPTQHEYIRPNETLTFLLSTTTDEKVTYDVDFGDGTTRTTPGNMISHSWQEEGNYDVTIVATTRTTSETVTKVVSIEWVEEGVVPEVVQISANPGPLSNEIILDLSAVSRYDMACTLQFGDGEILSITIPHDAYVNQMEERFVYAVAGIYDVDFACQNEYGETSARVTVPSSDYGVNFQTDERGVDIEVPILGADTHSDSFLAYVNEVQVVAEIGLETVVIPAAVFSYSGEHLVELKSDGTLLHKRIVNLQAPIQELNIIDVDHQVEWTDAVHLSFEIIGGDHIHTLIDYGDGTTERLYIPDSDLHLLLNRTHIYESVGAYLVKFKASNDVSFKTTSLHSSVERYLQVATVQAENVTDLGDPTTFTVIVDPDQSPAMPVKVMFDYGNGVQETVKLGEKSESPTPLYHSYIYPTYGIYRVQATVMNNISSIATKCLHQVGQNITYVDLYTSAERAVVGQEVNITVDAPRGSPIQFTIDMGDGTVITVHTPTLDIQKQYHDEDLSETGSGDGEVSLEESVLSLRKKREAGDVVNVTSQVVVVSAGEGELLAVYTTPSPEMVTNGSESDNVVTETYTQTEAAPTPTSPTPTEAYVPPNDKLVVSYIYDTAGDFQISVHISNIFTSAETVLCPDIKVLPSGSENQECVSFDVNIEDPDLVGSASLSAPHKFLRSHEFVIPASADVADCGGSENDYEVDYTLKAEWLTPSGEWRPELEACLLESHSPDLIIPSNTLWYGTYRLSVTSGLRIHHEALGRRRRSSDNETVTIVTLLGFNETSTTTTPTTTTTLPPPTTTEAAFTSDPTLITSSSEIYIEVDKTPLVAQIFGEEEPRDVTVYEVVQINMTGSHDPDVQPGNRTLLRGHLVCYRKENEGYETMTLSEIKEKAEMIAINGLKTVSLWDVDCFDMEGHNSSYVRVMGWDATFPGKYLVTMKEIVFKLFVTKDDRESSTFQEWQVWNSNTTSLLDNLADLLNSNDTSATLNVVGMIAGDLNAGAANSNDTEAKNKRTEIRGILINALGSVSDRGLENIDQLAATAGGLGMVTAAADEVTLDSKATAGGAMSASASMAGALTEEADVGFVSGMAGDMVGVAGNIMPFAEPPEEPELAPTPIYVSTTFLMASTTAFPDVYVEPQFIGQVNGSVWNVSGTYYSTTTPPPPTTTTLPPPTTIPLTTTVRMVTNPGVTQTFLDVTSPEGDLLEEFMIEEESCCEPLNGLCDWVEPECDYLDEDERKKFVWDNQTCDEIHPDDLSEIVFRFDLFKAMEKKMLFAQRKATTTGAMAAVGSMGDVLLGKSGDGDNITLSSPKLKMSVAKIGGGNVSMDGMDAPGSALEGMGEVGASSMESENPFTYSDSASSVNSKVKSLSFTDANGTTIKMENMTEDFVIWQDGKPGLVPPAGLYTFIASTEEMIMNFHTVSLPGNDSSLHIYIKPGSDSDIYQVFIKYMDFPNETYYDHVSTLPRHSSLDDEVYTGVFEEDEMLPYIYFPPMNVTRLNGTYRIGVRLIQTTMNFGSAAAMNNYTYLFRVFVSGCQFWDDNNDTWSSEGCHVGESTTIYRTKCLCNHLTSFGSDFVVPVNTIDFSSVFSLENLVEALPVFITVGLVLLMYLGVVIWARHMDKKDLIEWGAGPLEDNLPSDQYHYQITVYTGTKKLAGTKSKVSFIISGDDSDTGVRRLADGKRKELPASSIYNYVMSVESCLGPMTFLRIWHDNKGKGKQRSWFLNQFQVIDLQTGEKFFFLCDRWLAVEEDDGMVERVIPVAGMRELTAFKHLFGSSLRKKLTNDHLWVSIVKRPTKSNFTRVQRVSTCVALLFLTMITNCMFFKAEENMENPPTALKIGPFSFTLQTVFVAVVTTLIVFPPSILIVSIFRKARPKKNKVTHTNVVPSRKSNKYKWKSLEGTALLSSSNIQLHQRSRYQNFKEKLHLMMTSDKKAKYDDGPVEDPGLKKKKKPMTFPWWSIYIGWVVCLLAIFVSAFFTVLYSMQWGREKSLDWLATFLLSFFQSAVVVQPFKVLLLAAFISCIMRKPDLGEDDESFDEPEYNAKGGDDETMMPQAQRKYEEIIAQRKKATAFVQPPDCKEMEETRELRLKEIAMEAILKEVIIYFFFVMTTFFLSYQTRDSNSFQFAENIKNTFKRTSPAFDSAITPVKIYDYMRRVMIPNMYSSNWYNGQELEWQEALQMDDRLSIRAGVARLRQLRIKEDTCNVIPAMAPLIDHCRDDYNWLDDDTKDYLPRWIPDDGHNKHYTFIDCYADLFEPNATNPFEGQNPWHYSSSVKLANAPYPGTLTMYKGGGYTINFKRTAKASLKIVDDLEAHDWLDVKTRALFIEFTLYNANVNLFGSVIFLVEWMAAGSAITKTEVKVFRLHSYVGGWGVIVIAFEIAFVIFIIYFAQFAAKAIKKEKRKWFKNFWNQMDAMTLILAIVSIAMYAMKKVFAGVAIGLWKKYGSADYVNFVTISIWDELFGFMLATVVFTSTIKFIKMLRFNKRMSMLGDTIKLASKDLKCFAISFFIYFFSFAMMAYVIFGKDLADYGSFAATIESLFSFALGSFDFEALRGSNRQIGPVFFFMFVTIVQIGLLGMFLTIIDLAFATVKANSELLSNEYEIVDFMVGKLKAVFGWGGGDDKKKKKEEEEEEEEDEETATPYPE